MSILVTVEELLILEREISNGKIDMISDSKTPLHLGSGGVSFLLSPGMNRQKGLSGGAY